MELYDFRGQIEYTRSGFRKVDAFGLAAEFRFYFSVYLRRIVTHNTRIYIRITRSFAIRICCGIFAIAYRLLLRARYIFSRPLNSTVHWVRNAQTELQPRWLDSRNAFVLRNMSVNYYDANAREQIYVSGPLYTQGFLLPFSPLYISPLAINTLLF